MINGVQVLADAFYDDRVINLGSSFGPNIDLTIVSYGGEFILGDAVPEPSTWAMMLVGFAGLGLLAVRRSRKGAIRAWRDDRFVSSSSSRLVTARNGCGRFHEPIFLARPGGARPVTMWTIALKLIIGS
jgi:hypothetical protein